MTHHDAIICGAGVIGLSLALELRQRGLHVLILERAAPGGESSHAAAGMLAWCEAHSHPGFAALAEASYRAYPGFVHGIEDESGMKVDLRRDGTLQLLVDTKGEADPWPTHGWIRALAPGELARLEPHIAGDYRAVLLDEGTVDPRALCAALERAVTHRGVDLA